MYCEDYDWWTLVVAFPINEEQYKNLQQYEFYGYDDDTDDDSGYSCRDGLLNPLIKIRKQLMTGDYRVLYSVWEKYGDDDDEEYEIPVPKEKKTGMNTIQRLINILD